MPANTALISGLFALSGAILGQLLNNWLTNRRENKKYDKEVYQELYSPILSDLYAYIDISLNYRKMAEIKSEVKEDDHFINVREIVKSNLKYAGPNLISAYQQYCKTDYYENYSGYGHFAIKLRFALAILDETYTLVKKNNILNNEQLDTMNYYRVLYYTWILILQNLKDNALALHIMRHHWLFNKEKFNESFYERIKVRFEMVKEEYFSTVFKEEFFPIMAGETGELEGIFDEEIMKALNHEPEVVKQAHEYVFYSYEFNRDIVNTDTE